MYASGVETPLTGVSVCEWERFLEGVDTGNAYTLLLRACRLLTALGGGPGAGDASNRP